MIVEMTLERQFGDFCACTHAKGKRHNKHLVLAVTVNLKVKEGVGLTVIHVAPCRCPCDPAAIVNLALPLAGDIAIDEVGVLTADEQHYKIVAEVLQLHPDR